MPPISNIKLKFLTALFCAAAGLALAGESQAATYYVSPTGSGSAACTSVTAACTYARAQSVASNGDTIIVGGGTYIITSAWNLSKSGLIWQAATGETPVLDGAENYPDTFYGSLVSITGDNITLRGIDITRSKSYGLIVGQGADRNIIDDVNISYCWLCGFSISQVNYDNILQNSRIYRNERRKYYYDNPSLRPDSEWNYEGPWGANVSLVNAKRTIVRNNRIYENYFEGLGIYRDSENVLAENNQVYGNARLQVYLSSSRLCTVRHNVIYGTVSWDGSKSALGISGLWLAGETPRASENRDYGHRCYGNFIANSNKNHWLAGEGLAAVRDSYIFNNVFVEALDRDGNEGTGVQVQSVVGSEYGLGNVVKNNAFLQNINTVDSISNVGRVAFSNNLWSRNPSNADGTGDVIGNFSLATVFTSPHISGTLSKSDFEFRSSSLLYQNKGSWLTTTSGAASNSVTVIVENAGYFHGDEQLKFSNGSIATIRSKSGNTLTVSPAVTVSQGTGVHLAIFTPGSAPNIGPWEEGSSGSDTTAPAAPSGLSVR